MSSTLIMVIVVAVLNIAGRIYKERAKKKQAEADARAGKTPPVQAAVPSEPVPPARAAQAIDTKVAQRRARREAKRAAAMEGMRTQSGPSAITTPPVVAARKAPVMPPVAARTMPATSVPLPGRAAALPSRSPALAGRAAALPSRPPALPSLAAERLPIALMRTPIASTRVVPISKVRTAAPSAPCWSAQDLRRGLVIGEVLGAPRAVRPWSPPTWD